MASGTGISVNYGFTEDGRRKILLSGFRTTVCAVAGNDKDSAELEVIRYADDSPYGFGSAAHPISGRRILRGDSEVALPKKDRFYLGQAQRMMTSITPTEEPYKDLRECVVEALSICPPQPSQTM